MSPAKSVLFLLISQFVLISCSLRTENSPKAEEVKPVSQPIPSADTLSFESIGISEDSLYALFTSEDANIVVVDKFAGPLANVNGECQAGLFVLIKVTQDDIEEFSLYNLNYSIVDGEPTISLSVEESFPVGFQTGKVMSMTVDSTMHDRCDVLVVTDNTNFGEATGSNTLKTIYALNEEGVLQQLLSFVAQEETPPGEYDTLSSGSTYIDNAIHSSATSINGFKNIELLKTTREYDTIFTTSTFFRYSEAEQKYVQANN